MTICCYKDGILATDSQNTGTPIEHDAVKIYRLEGGDLCTGVGYRPNIEAFIDWLSLPLEERKAKKLDYDKDAFTVMVVNRFTIDLYYNGCPIPCVLRDRRFYAIGNYWQMAMGAMEFGATSAEACLLVSRYDETVDDVIQEVAL
jgi:hypothetical protein